VTSSASSPLYYVYEFFYGHFFDDRGCPAEIRSVGDLGSFFDGEVHSLSGNCLLLGPCNMRVQLAGYLVLACSRRWLVWDCPNVAPYTSACNMTSLLLLT